MMDGSDLKVEDCDDLFWIDKETDAHEAGDIGFIYAEDIFVDECFTGNERLALLL